MTDSNTSNATVTTMIQSGREQTQAIERAPGVFESRGIGNSYLVHTSEGNVLINAGTLGDAKRGKPLFDKAAPGEIKTIILTQSHANQFGGLEVYKTTQNTVIAQHNYPAERKYFNALSEHYQRGSRRIFRSVTGPRKDILPTQEVAPDVLIDEFHAFTLGGQEFELHWTPGGETRSALIVWLPQKNIAIVGNLFGPLFGNQPNLNTLRGDKPRSALEFIDSVSHLRALRPAMILTGHEVIEGEEHIQQELTRIIDSVQWLHDRTLEGMNAGTPLRQLMQTIKPPADLTLTEEYGRVPWNVRAIWHEYTGWFDANLGSSEMYGVAPKDLAPHWLALAGGSEPVAEKARALLDEAQPEQAIALLDSALAVEPHCQACITVKRQAIADLQIKNTANNLWLRQWLAAELDDLEDG